MKRLLLASTVLAIAVPTPAMAASYLSDYEIGILRGANSLGAPYLDAPMGVLSNIGFVIAAPLGLSIAADPNGYSAPLLVLASEGLAYGATAGLKPLIHRIRPYESYAGIRTPQGQTPDDPYSLPSGHAAVSFAAATVIGDWNPTWRWPAYGLAALISYSRMYNGMHYPTDLVAGALLGVGIGKATRWGLDHLNGKYGFPTLEDHVTLGVGDGLMLGMRTAF